MQNETKLPTLASFKGIIKDVGKSAEQLLQEERDARTSTEAEINIELKTPPSMPYDLRLVREVDGTLTWEEGLPLELCPEYDGAARWCAQRGLKGTIGDPLPPNMDPSGALKWINADPESFQKRVREFSYAIAMDNSRTTP